MKKTDIQIARSLLGKDDIVFVIVNNGEILFSSVKKGIQPFFDTLAALPRESFAGCSLADRVIGKAALLLAAYIGAKEIYTPLASEHAKAAALKLNLNLVFDKSTDFIKDRTQDGMCPMEEAVLDVNDPEEAYQILKSTLQKLKNM